MEENEALGLGVRSKIYKLIEKSPGLHFREIQRRTEIAVGSLQYHLDFLQKRHLIKIVKDGKFARYYSIRKGIVEQDERTISLLRQYSVRKIVLFLLSKKRGTSNQAIADAVMLSPSTCSFHLSKLLGANIIGKRQRGRKSLFYLIDRNQTAQLLVGYRKSFLDEMVDNFAEIWEGI